MMSDTERKMVRLAEIFQDNMVLQREKEVRLMGECMCACTLTVYLNNVCVAEKQCEAGAFAVMLPGQRAMENATLLVHAACADRETEIVFSNVDFGEVWIAGGQSNMEFALRFDAEGGKQIAAASDEHFRFYDVGEYASAEAKRAPDAPAGWDRWLSYCPAYAPDFSAVGTYFALMLRERLKVPVGIVGCNWGGTSASAWVPEQLLRGNRKLRVYTDRYERDMQGFDPQKYEKQLQRERAYWSRPSVARESEHRMKYEVLGPPGHLARLKERVRQKRLKLGPCSQNRPGGLYEVMVRQAAGYTAAGVLWYQGETDYDHADIYEELLRTLIGAWREAWGEKLPFLLVQLASYEGWAECSGETFHIIRRSQQKVADEGTGIYLASIMDVGSRYDIHPKRKRPVGERLGRLALHYIYGSEESCEAPRLIRLQREADGALAAVFDHAQGGLAARGEIGPLFTVTADGKEVDCEASLKESCVILRAAALAAAKNVEVSFAYRPFCEMTLFSGDGLAARPSGPMKAQGYSATAQASAQSSS